MTVLLPQIQGMLDRLGGEMTWSARILINGSSFIAQIGPFFLLGLIIGIISFPTMAALRIWTGHTDSWLLKVPLLGKIFYLGELFQVGNLISTLLESGINTTETLRLTERTVKIPNCVNASTLHEVRSTKGSQSHRPFKETIHARPSGRHINGR